MNTYSGVAGAPGMRWNGFRTIAEVTRPGVAVVRREDRVVTAMALLRANGASHAVVMKGSEVEGVVAQHDLDALCWMLRGSTAAWIRELLVEDVMQSHPLILDGEATIFEAAGLLGEGSHACVVVLVDGRPAGILREPDLHPPPVAPDALLRPRLISEGALRR